jgi:nucleolar MIF4G domain-containing protein 1
VRKTQNQGHKIRKPQSKPQVQNAKRPTRPEPESEAEEDGSEDETPPPRPSKVKEAEKPRKSILKSTKSDQQSSKTKERSPSPPPRLSRAAKDRLAQDDDEISALEKKLGIKKKKKKSDDDLDDGLEDLFGELGDFGSDEETAGDKPPKRKRAAEDEKWLASKRRKALGQAAEVSSDEDSDMEDEEGMDDFGSDEDMDSENSDFGGFDTDEEEEEAPPAPRVRENPYVAPVTSDTPQPTKYIPPALRGPPSSDSEALARLKRQIQGLLNRLSDANLLTILKDIEKIYQNNARGYVNSTVIDLLIGLLSDETVLPDTFLILHSGFVAAIYKVIGPDFGAQMIEQIVSEFDKHYQRNKAGTGKHATNLISLVAQLYCFQVVGSNLVFDYIRLFLSELSDINTELLLRIVKVAGSQIRQDDPTSLKEIVLQLQKSVADVGESTLPVRTRFMIETINNLKNNRMKTGVSASGIVTEHTTRMKKQLGTMNARNLKGTEPLRISLADIRDTEKKGKWWLVGASWRNDTASNEPSQENEESNLKEQAKGDAETDGEVDLVQLAREQRMNTDVRRAIFVTIMSASDFKDAHMRLLKLNLKRSQEMEIPRVIVHCAGCEKIYNPYYTLLARKFCSDHKSRKCFQFALWDIFKSLGEKREDEEDSEDEDEENKNDVSLRRLVNLGKLYGTLIARNGLPITSLKTLNFPYLQPKTKTLIEILLVTTILESQKGADESRNEKGLLNIFINADTAPEMITALQYFLKKVVSKTDLAADKAEKDTVKWACKSVVAMLSRVMASTTLDEE